MLDARILDHLVRPVVADRAPEELVLFGPTLRDFEIRSGQLATDHVPSPFSR